MGVCYERQEVPGGRTGRWLIMEQQFFYMGGNSYGE